MRFLYLAALLVSFAGMAVLDFRFKLALWRRPLATVVVVLISAVFLLAADLTAIASGIFYRGSSPGMIGAELAPELPVEEPVFLLFLSYLAMVLLFGFQRLWGRRAARSERR